MTLDISMWIWLPLSLAIILAFIHKNKISITLLIVSLIGGLIESRLSVTGLVVLIVGIAIAYRTPAQEGKWRIGSYTFVTFWCVALFLHAIPGGNNAKVLDAVICGPQSTPFTMYLNIDKPLIFFVLLLSYPALLGSKKTFHKKAIILSVIPLFSLLPIAWRLGAYSLR